MTLNRQLRWPQYGNGMEWVKNLVSSIEGNHAMLVQPVLKNPISEQTTYEIDEEVRELLNEAH